MTLLAAFYKKLYTESHTSRTFIKEPGRYIGKTIHAPLNFKKTQAQDPCFLDERYLGQLVVGMEYRMKMLQKIPKWIPMRPLGQYAHTFVALMMEVDTALTSGETMYWIGCPEIPEKVVEAIQLGMKISIPNGPHHPRQI